MLVCSWSCLCVHVWSWLCTRSCGVVLVYSYVRSCVVALCALMLVWVYVVVLACVCVWSCLCVRSCGRTHVLSSCFKLFQVVSSCFKFFQVVSSCFKSFKGVMDRKGAVTSC